MKKKLFLFLALVVTMIPFITNAKTYYDGYSTMNLVETLKAEGMEIENKNYKETNDQAIVYMFRGQGCGFCRKFLTFINSISKEYGKYFKLISFEVWNDQQNSALFGKMYSVTGVPTEGVPYVIIGSKVFDGYTESYNEQIKEAIMNEYKKKDVDIFEKLQQVDDGTLAPIEKPSNDNNGEDANANNYSNTSSSSNSDTFAIVFWNFIFVAVGVGCLIYFQTKTRNEILEKLNEVNPKETKKETKKKN